ncbi:MAG: msrA [Bacteroidetes bacterium]|jgi:peptide-methionine (S)-S-oxide reductase|nr:msrA [Bacteroidota bacterium]
MKSINKFKMAVTTITAVFFISACGQAKNNSATSTMSEPTLSDNSNMDTATFGAGCFWCIEAVFQRLNGVVSVKSGYSGGFVKNPSYREVCAGTTGHAEVAQIVYDKTKISFDELLEVFWKTHDPTTLNYQGNDHGTQYRSAIFYHNEEQKKLAEKYKEEINKSGAYPNPIVTEITALTNFYPAEDYHQNYYNQNGSEGYCRYVIQPKVEKFEKIFKNKLKH